MRCRFFPSAIIFIVIASSHVFRFLVQYTGWGTRLVNRRKQVLFRFGESGFLFRGGLWTLYCDLPSAINEAAERLTLLPRDQSGGDNVALVISSPVGDSVTLGIGSPAGDSATLVRL